MRYLSNHETSLHISASTDKLIMNFTTLEDSRYGLIFELPS